MDLGTFYDSLVLMPGDYTVKIGLDAVVGVCSWRGIYAEASLDSVYKAEPVTVSQLVLEIERLFEGEPRTGWKGGDFVYCEGTRLWADPEGECCGYYPAGLTVDTRGRIVQVVTCHRDPYNL